MRQISRESLADFDAFGNYSEMEFDDTTNFRQGSTRQGLLHVREEVFWRQIRQVFRPGDPSRMINWKPFLTSYHKNQLGCPAYSSAMGPACRERRGTPPLPVGLTTQSRADARNGRNILVMMTTQVGS